MCGCIPPPSQEVQRRRMRIEREILERASPGNSMPHDDVGAESHRLVPVTVSVEAGICMADRGHRQRTVAPPQTFLMFGDTEVIPIGKHSAVNIDTDASCV